MLNSVFAKTFYEKRWVLAAWVVAIFAMTLLTMVFFPYFKNAGFEEVVANAPKSIQGLLGSAANYKTVQGYVDQQIFALRLPLLLIVMNITLYVGIGVGDEDRGVLEPLLSQPVTRAQVFWQKLAAGAVITGIASLAIILAVIASYPSIHGSMDSLRLIEATFGCWLVSFFFGALTYSIGTATGKRGLTIAVGSGLAFFTYLISSMAPAVQQLQTANKFTPFYYYNSPSIAMHGITISHLLVLVASIAALLVVSLVIFRRRDLIRD